VRDVPLCFLFLCWTHLGVQYRLFNDDFLMNILTITHIRSRSGMVSMVWYGPSLLLVWRVSWDTSSLSYLSQVCPAKIRSREIQARELPVNFNRMWIKWVMSKGLYLFSSPHSGCCPIISIDALCTWVVLDNVFSWAGDGYIYIFFYINSTHFTSRYFKRGWTHLSGFRVG